MRWTILLLASKALATGNAGCLERLFSYSAYVAEEVMGEPYTIAPGCRSSDGGRCDFNDFLKYIWTPNNNKKEGPANRPTHDIITGTVDVLSKYVKLITVLNLLTQGASKNVKSTDKDSDDKSKGNVDPNSVSPKEARQRGVSVCDWVDSKRLFPGAADYADAMLKVGDVVKKARTWMNDADNIPSSKESTESTKSKKYAKMTASVSRAVKSIQSVQDIRAQERDNNNKHPRLQEVQDAINDAIKKDRKSYSIRLSTKTCRDLNSVITSNKKQVLDVAQSFKDLGKDAYRLEPALADWQDADAANARHNSMLTCTKLTSESCGCA